MSRTVPFKSLDTCCPRRYTLPGTTRFSALVPRGASAFGSPILRNVQDKRQTRDGIALTTLRMSSGKPLAPNVQTDINSRFGADASHAAACKVGQVMALAGVPSDWHLLDTDDQGLCFPRTARCRSLLPGDPRVYVLDLQGSADVASRCARANEVPTRNLVRWVEVEQGQGGTGVTRVALPPAANVRARVSAGREAVGAWSEARPERLDRHCRDRKAECR